MSSVDRGFSWEQLAQDIAHGVARFLDGRRRGRPEPHNGGPRHPIECDIIGVIGERIMSAYLGIPWHPMVAKPGLLEGDVGVHQVRSTDVPHGCLTVYEENPDDVPYWLVTVNVRVPMASIKGWAWGHEVKQREYFRTDREADAFWLPQSKLHDPSTAPAIVRAPRAGVDGLPLLKDNSRRHNMTEAWILG